MRRTYRNKFRTRRQREEIRNYIDIAIYTVCVVVITLGLNYIINH